MAPPLPHDALFKSTFSKPELARAELEAILPAEILANLDLDALALVPGSFVDDELRASLTDLLFTAKLRSGDEALLYLLFEHLSQPDSFQPLRLLRYEVSIWEAWRKENPAANSLPLILPVVVHHGPGGWKGAPGLRQLFALTDEELAPFRTFLPLFQFVLDDVGTLSLPELTSRALPPQARVALLAFWSTRQWDRLLEAEPWIREAVAQWPKDHGGKVLLSQIFFYIRSGALRHVEKQEVFSILSRMAGADHQDTITTWGEQFYADARADGRREGHLAGLQEGLRQGLQDGLEQGLHEGLEQGLRDGLEQGLHKGLEQGLAALRSALMDILRGKAIVLSEARAQLLASCTDLSTLTSWVTRASVASCEDDIFET